MKIKDVSTLVIFSYALLGCGGATPTTPIWEISITEDSPTTQSLLETGDGLITRFTSNSTGDATSETYSWDGELISEQEHSYLGANANLIQHTQNDVYSLSFSRNQNDIVTKLSSNFEVQWQIDTETTTNDDDYRQFAIDINGKYIAISGTREVLAAGETEATEEEFVLLISAITGEIISDFFIYDYLDVKSIVVTEQGTIHVGTTHNNLEGDVLLSIYKDYEIPGYFGLTVNIDALATIDEDPLLAYRRDIQGIPNSYIYRFSLNSDSQWETSVGITLISQGIDVTEGTINLFGDNYISGATLVNLNADGDINWKYHSGNNSDPSKVSLQPLSNGNKLLSFTTDRITIINDGPYLSRGTTNTNHHIINANGEATRKITQESYIEKRGLWGTHPEVVQAGIIHSWSGLIAENKGLVLLSDIEGEAQEHETKLVLY